MFYGDCGIHELCVMLLAAVGENTQAVTLSAVFSRFDMLIFG